MLRLLLRASRRATAPGEDSASPPCTAASHSVRPVPVLCASTDPPPVILRLLPILWLAGCLGAADSDSLPAEAQAPVDMQAPVDTLGPPADKLGLAADTASADTLESTRPVLPDGFVRLSEVAPGIAQEMRYTTAYNFVGEPIDGYLAPECILTEQTAEALVLVAEDLEAEGLGLKVYDCYRPQRAVNHFARWARGSDSAMKRAFYPDENRRRLFQRGYIASRSGHSRGSTVDLTLVPLPARQSVLTSFPTPEDGRPLPRCDRPRTGPTGPDIEGGGRLHEGDLDMGTAYDCLDTSAATRSREVSAEVRQNRQRLVDAMSERGFRNYSKEWWHFTFWREQFPGTYHDFPVR